MFVKCRKNEARYVRQPLQRLLACNNTPRHSSAFVLWNQILRQANNVVRSVWNWSLGPIPLNLRTYAVELYFTPALCAVIPSNGATFLDYIFYSHRPRTPPFREVLHIRCDALDILISMGSTNKIKSSGRQNSIPRLSWSGQRVILDPTSFSKHPGVL